MADRPLPEGWRIVSLHASGDEPRIVGPRQRVTDADIARADAIRVSHTSRRTGVTSFRTIHGASSKRQIGDLIRSVVRVVSPT